MTPALEEPRSGAGARDAMIAVKSALVLGSSLLATWGVALVVRLYLPRHLGPDLFGALNFADALAATCFIVLGLGVETYIQREIPVRPQHASDFVGGLLAVRAALAVIVFGVMALLMALAGRPPFVQRTAFVFGAAQILVGLNATLAALLHASREVKGLALANVLGKALWAAGVALAVWRGVGLTGLALAFLVAEGVRAALLARLVKRHLGLRLQIDPRAVRAVFIACLPFYLNQVSNTVYGKIDVSLLSVIAGDREVGWYGSASNLAGLSLLVSPLIGSVLLPLLSRAAARSREELFFILRRAIEAVLLIVIPLALMMGVGADVWIPLLFGHGFTPATTSLRILAPLFALGYLTMISASCLFMLKRAWTVAVISMVALLVNPTLNLLFVPAASRWLGPGGAGAGAALALLLTEMGVAVALTVSIPERIYDDASRRSVGRALLSCVAVVALDRALAPIGPTRLAIDAIAYVALLFATGAIRVKDLRRLARFVLNERRRHDPS